jgi:UMF1 family MFS transporter
MIAPSAASDRDADFARLAWILIDWAASAFSTVLITLVVAYVEKVVMPQGAWGMDAGVVWAWTLAAAMLVSAALAPCAAAWADRHDAHQRALVVGTLLGAGGLVALAAVPTEARLAVVASVIAACIGFDISQIFTGSLLQRITGGRDTDRLSAQGFAAGYAGGAIALIVATSIVAARDRLGLDAPAALRLAFVVTAAWWLVFSLPAAVARFASGNGAGHAANTGRELLSFTRSLFDSQSVGDRPFRGVLAGAMLALGGIQTAIAQFTSLALQRFDLDGPALVRLVLLVQAVALPGALGVGWMATRFGRRPATAICLGGWILVLVLAWFVRSPVDLHWLAVLLALVLGGAQSLLRAAVATLTPAGHSGIAFGLLQVGTKLAGFMASLAFGAMLLATGMPEAGLLALIVQLVAAWWIIRRAV